MIQNLAFSSNLKFAGVMHGMTITPIDYLFLEMDPGLCFKVRKVSSETECTILFCYTQLSLSQVPGVYSRTKTGFVEFFRKVFRKLKRLFFHFCKRGK